MGERPTGKHSDNSFDAQWDKIARELEAEGVGANIDSVQDGGTALPPVDVSPRYTDAAWALGGGRATGPRDWSPAPDDSDFSNDDATFDPASREEYYVPQAPAHRYASLAWVATGVLVLISALMFIGLLPAPRLTAWLLAGGALVGVVVAIILTAPAREDTDPYDDGARL
ncbi:SdpI family protein [Actinotignum sanguinis]|uniref:SdpI family protein n=1 Tax=Actinotignum sanguinis TaxID=1445614 RepID=UPI000F7E29A8|nr:SdpI family protein [Actinotignum sanguinis]MDY5148460.1 SdpI family protein [Actinotignum sanguinis]